MLGVNGAQGSGKSTLCHLLALVVEQSFGRSVAVLSIDDLYLTRAERLQLAQSIHPLCAVRGLPGTHDVALGVALFAALDAARPTSITRIPRFNKATDDRREDAQWDTVHGRPDIVLFEGWCVAARPTAPWTGPINERERRDDLDGTWARWTNAALQRDYPALFDRIDSLLMIQVPSMQTVRDGRWRQEQALWQNSQHGGGTVPLGLMTQQQVDDYVALFERLTTSTLAEMPSRADILLKHNVDASLALTNEPQSVREPSDE